MRIKGILFTLLAAILITISASAQELKFGHISVADVVLLMPEYKNIGTVMEQESKKLEGQLKAMQEELKKIELEYEEKYETYTPELRAAKETEYGTMQQRVQEFYSNAQQSLQQKQQELQMPVLEKLRSAIEKVGSENGFLYIFEVDSGLTLFHSQKSVDVTSLVKTELGI